MLNLTQHLITPEQIKAGVTEPKDKCYVRRLLTFEELPTTEQIEHRAYLLARYAAAESAKKVMIGGVPFLMSRLEQHLAIISINAYYALSVRACIEERAGGTVTKHNVFHHIGFIPAPSP